MSSGIGIGELDLGREAAEWVLLASGEARLQFDVGRMSPGSFVNIPAHQRCRVDGTDPNQPTVWKTAGQWRYRAPDLSDASETP